MKKFYQFGLVTICFFLNLNNVFTQNNRTIDSLLHWLSLNNKHDTIWINNLISLEKEYYISIPEKVGTYADTIINVSKELNYGFGIINGYSFKTLSLINKNQYNVAIKTVFEKLNFVEKYNNIEEKANSFMQLGYLYALLGNNEKSLESYLKAKSIAETIPNSNPSKERLIFAITINTGMAYSVLNQKEKAIEGYLLADSLLKKSNQLKNSTYYYHQVAVWLNLGDTYRNLKEIKQSTYFLEKAIALANNKEITVALSKAYIALFANYIDDNRIIDAKTIKVNIEKLRTNNLLSANDLALYYQYLNQYYLKINDYKGAYESILNYYVINDSIIGLEQKKQMQELTVKYETEKKDKDLAKQKEELALKEKEQKTYLIYFLSASVIALFVFLQLLYRHFLINKKALNALKIADEQTQKAKEAESFSHTISHDLRHPIIQVRNTLDALLKQSNFDEESTKQLIKAHMTLQQTDLMVKQLLSLFMLEEEEPYLSEVDTNQLIEEVIEKLGTKVQNLRLQHYQL